jgi:hypothetical protein
MTRTNTFILGVALALALATWAEAQDAPPMYAKTRSNYRSIRAAAASPTPNNEWTGRSADAVYAQAREQNRQNNEWTRNYLVEQSEPFYYYPYYYNPWVGIRVP